MKTRNIRQQQVDLSALEDRITAVESLKGLGQVAGEINTQMDTIVIAHGYKVTPIVTVVKENVDGSKEVILCDIQHINDNLVAVSWESRFNGWVYLR
ncbi:MAG: hypothetical protein ACTTJH_00625 [Bacteroidales bacterium]